MDFRFQICDFRLALPVKIKNQKLEIKNVLT